MNVPKLRFKEFNDEWTEATLGKFTNVLMCKRIFANQTSESYEVPFYKIGTIGSTPDTYISRELFEEYRTKYNYPKKSEILITCSGTVGKCIVFNGEDAYFQDSNIVWIDNPNNVVNNIFLYYILSNVDWSRLNSTTIVRIYGDNLRQLKIKYPTEKEQSKIINTLSLLDKKIELQSKKIEALKLFKKGLVSNIFASFENTTKYKLGELLKEANIKTKTNNEHFIISSTTKGIFLQSEYFNKQAASDNNIGYKILKKNQLVLSPQNLWMGNININDKYNFGIVSPSYKIYDINNINLDLFKEWIKTARALYEYNMSSEQGASIVRKNLNEDLFKDITIYLPNLQFQNKYGNLFNKLNAKINLENNKLNNLQELKKGLMQNMFV